MYSDTINISFTCTAIIHTLTLHTYILIGIVKLVKQMPMPDTKPPEQPFSQQQQAGQRPSSSGTCSLYMMCNALLCGYCLLLLICCLCGVCRRPLYYTTVVCIYFRIYCKIMAYIMFNVHYVCILYRWRKWRIFAGTARRKPRTVGKHSFFVALSWCVMTHKMMTPCVLVVFSLAFVIE